MTTRAGRLTLIAAVLAAIAAAALLPLGPWALALVEWVRSAGVLGLAVFALAYVLATLLLLPGSLLTAGAGFTYGPALGTLVVSPVTTVAATLAFLLGRSLARGWVSSRIARHRRFAAVDRAVGTSGFKLVFLLRLSPVFPSSILNYALGLTSVRPRDYVAASLLGMLPGTFLYAYLGSLAAGAGELLNGRLPAAGPTGLLLRLAGLIATILAVAMMARVARRALRQALTERAARR